MKVTAKFVSTSAEVSVELRPEATVDELKQAIARQVAVGTGPTGLTAENLRLIHQARALGEPQSATTGATPLQNCLPDGATVFVVKTLAKPAPARDGSQSGNLFFDALMNAIFTSNVEGVRVLLREPAVARVLNLWDRERYTPLMRACQAGNVDIARLLVFGGANVDVVRAPDCATAFSLATALSGHGSLPEDSLRSLISVLKRKDSLFPVGDASAAAVAPVQDCCKPEI
eukprot:RCo054156